MTMPKSIEDIARARGRTDDGKTVGSRGPVSGPRDSAVAAETRQIARRQPHECLRTPVVGLGVEAAELSGTPDAQSKTEWRRHKLSFCKDHLARERYPGRGQGRIIAPLAFQE